MSKPNAKITSQSAADGATERQQDQSSVLQNPLQKQAGAMLTDPNSMEAFASRVSVADIAHGSESAAALKGANADADQQAQALDANPNAELLDGLKDVDRAQAVDAAVSKPELQVAGMHHEDEAFAQEVRLRRTGQASA